jgi:hypothetical protein
VSATLNRWVSERQKTKLHLMQLNKNA